MTHKINIGTCFLLMGSCRGEIEVTVLVDPGEFGGERRLVHTLFIFTNRTEDLCEEEFSPNSERD